MTKDTATLSIRDLAVSFATHDGIVHAVRGVSFDVMAGRCTAIVGESGSGKSQTCMAIMGLLPDNARTSGSIRVGGEEVLGRDRKVIERLRGSRMGMIFQDPLTALTPHMRIGEQIMEGLRAHRGLSGSAARLAAREWLERVRIPDAARRMRQYPHELSGGMRQRVMIAAAMSCEPALLLADEPTTALDVTVQSEVLDILADLMREMGTALVIVTHDMGVVARLADEACVMKDGLFVESDGTASLFANPGAAYTRRLLSAVPRWDTPVSLPEVAPQAPVIVSGRDIRVQFPVSNGLFRKPAILRAVDGVDLSIRAGETLGVVGESGCGKSTLSRAVLNLLPVGTGSVTFLGRDLGKLDRKAMQAARRDLQIVFQDPFASLDPRMTIGASIAQPLLTHQPHLARVERQRKVRKAMERVGLPASLSNRYPHELSGGQNQRAGIARATILKPRLLICDEAVSALDVSIRRQIIDLLIDLQKGSGMAMMFISHDLAAVREISHRVMVLYLGRVVEEASCDTLYRDPGHPYTRALLAAALTPDPAHERHRKRIRLAQEPPSPLDRAAAFRYLPSRLAAQDSENAPLPALRTVSPGHLVAEFDATLFP